MKLTDEEINKAAANSQVILVSDCGFYDLNFTRGARFAEARLLPLIEGQEWLLIDTQEKRDALSIVRPGDEFWTVDGKWCPLFNAGPFENRRLYRRPIKWTAVKDAPIPRGVPVLIPKYQSPQLRHFYITEDATHWRYAQIPEPPKINPDDEAFEKWLEDQNGDLMMVNPKDEKTIEILRRCFNSGMAHGRGAK